VGRAVSADTVGRWRQQLDINQSRQLVPKDVDGITIGCPSHQTPLQYLEHSEGKLLLEPTFTKGGPVLNDGPPPSVNLHTGVRG
jgi:hypothetical protein